ncbi:MAG: hypothetical protein JWO85_465 [Candidatus Eremiobacteraeota bacterium]|nr:hypothetical protein [Candidatus Eremiobacteraeota bacterium]
MLFATAAAAGLMMLMNPVDPHAIQHGAPHATFPLRGYSFTSAKTLLAKPAAIAGPDGLTVHLVFAAPLTGRCEIFELVNDRGIKNVAYPWDNGEGRLAIAGHQIKVEIDLHSDAELHAVGMTRERPAIGMDCWRRNDEAHTFFSTIYVLQNGRSATASLPRSRQVRRDPTASVTM